MSQSSQTDQENNARDYEQNNKPQKQRSGKPSLLARFLNLVKGSLSRSPTPKPNKPYRPDQQVNTLIDLCRRSKTSTKSSTGETPPVTTPKSRNVVDTTRILEQEAEEKMKMLLKQSEPNRGPNPPSPKNN